MAMDIFYLNLCLKSWEINVLINKLQANKYSLFIFAFGFLFLFAAFYPGFMSSDSIQQYEQARTLEFTDALPPIMSWVWSKLLIIRDGPEVLLAAHLALLWWGLWFWSKNAKGYPWSPLYIALGFAPWIACIAGVLWKDVGMAFCLLIVMAAVSSDHFNSKKLFYILPLLIYAYMVRHNAIFAIAPILWLITYRLFPNATYKIVLTISIILIIFLSSIANIFNHQYLNAKPIYLERYVMNDDLFHLSLVSNRSLIPFLDNYDEIIRCSKVELMETTLIGRGFCLNYAHPADYKVLYSETKKNWLSAIQANFYEYVKFRISAFFYFLRSPSLPPYYFWHNGIDNNTLGLQQSENIANNILLRYVKETSIIFPFLFKPYWWLIFSIFFLASTFFMVGSKRSVINIRVLLISSLLYILGYIPITTAADYRYIYWSVLGISIAFIYFINSDLTLKHIFNNKK
jgi:hypothetical protein